MYCTVCNGRACHLLAIRMSHLCRPRPCSAAIPWRLTLRRISLTAYRDRGRRRSMREDPPPACHLSQSTDRLIEDASAAAIEKSAVRDTSHANGVPPGGSSVSLRNERGVSSSHRSTARCTLPFVRANSDATIKDISMSCRIGYKSSRRKLLKQRLRTDSRCSPRRA